jgi:ribosomal-protein-alanine N-acetyltransferase
MSAADLPQAMEIAAALKEAPHWPLSVYQNALDPSSPLRRVSLVAADGASGAVVGFAIAGLIPPEAELETIAVEAGSQRRGVGRRLLVAVVDAIKLAGARELWLEVRVSNTAAIQLYRQNGFEERGRRSHYYVDPVEDAVLMRLALD